jgi:hypothetical protein
MVGPIDYEMWLPIVVTASLLILLVFAVADVASRTWADLLGLFYLLAAPFIYRVLRSVVTAGSSARDPSRDGARTG